MTIEEVNLSNNQLQSQMEQNKPSFRGVDDANLPPIAPGADGQSSLSLEP
jgi:hypothetical protein